MGQHFWKWYLFHVVPFVYGVHQESVLSPMLVIICMKLLEGGNKQLVIGQFWTSMWHQQNGTHFYIYSPFSGRWTTEAAFYRSPELWAKKLKSITQNSLPDKIGPERIPFYCVIEFVIFVIVADDEILNCYFLGSC